ncbi:MAG: SDR family oxidoreductase [Deltaproteobacteria bacterium]|nr:SDR family oxidoreductase [Deltaproteobacteria bacterium]
MKTILITGATAGIGRHAALELVRQGHHVIATGRREHALVALAEEARAIGRGKLEGIRLDVCDEANVREVAAEVLERTGGTGIHVLVNNAGYGQMGPLEEVSDAELRKQYDTNVFGLMNVTRAFLPQLRANVGRGEGTPTIVNVSSIGGRVTFPLMGAYNSTKYAVESLSDALRRELAPFGIAVSLVEPGPIRTEFNDTAMATIDHGRVGGSVYAPVVAQAEKFRAQFEKQSAGPEVTTRAIVHAVTARRPRVRYVVPFSSAAMLAIMSWLPTRVVDWAMRLMSGLTPKTLRSAAAPALPARATT